MLNFTEEKLGCPASMAENTTLESHLRPHQTLHRFGGLHSLAPLLLLRGLLFSTLADSCPVRAVPLQTPWPSAFSQPRRGKNKW